LRSLDVPGDSAPTGDDAMGLLNPVTAGYFETSGITLNRGRDFNAEDCPNGQKVAVISESVARRYFAGRDPVGRQIRYGGDGGLCMAIGARSTDVSCSICAAKAVRRMWQNSHSILGTVATPNPDLAAIDVEVLCP